MSCHFKLPEDAERMISERCRPKDQTDAQNFDPVAFLNARFDENTRISAISQCYQETVKSLSATENNFLSAVEKQAQYGDASSPQSSAQARADPLLSVRQAVKSLSSQVAGIKIKAQRSEETVNDVSDHIRKLDLAKKNIASSIFTLRCIQLWMLQLQAVITAFEKEKYVECQDALKEAQTYQSQLSHLFHLPQMKEINDQHMDLCKQLESKSYYLIFISDEESPLEHLDERTLTALCGIVDLLGETSRNRVRDHLIEQLLRPYALRFKRGTEDAKLEKTERRYSFMRNILDRYSGVLFSAFPKKWCLPQELCLSFALRTKEELDFQLREARGRMEVAVLTFILQKTIDIEKDLTLFVAWKEDFPGRELLPQYKFNGIILSAFKEHMGIFVKNEASLAKEVLAQPILGAGQTIVVGWNGETEAEVRIGAVLPLSEDIFVFIKESLKRAVRISQPEVLVDMASVWRDTLLKFSTSITALLPTSASSLQDLRRASIIANTALLCRTTSRALGDELQSRSGLPAAELRFQSVVDSFSTLYSSAIQSVVSGVNQTLQPLFQSYVKGFAEDRANSKGSVTQAQSSSRRAFRSIVSALHDRFLTCSGVMTVEALRFLLDKMGAGVVPIYIRCLYDFARITTNTAKLLYEDALALKKVFLELPNYNDPLRFTTTALSIYGKLVDHQFETMICSLKVMQASTSNMEAFANAYYDTVPSDDRSIAHFVRLVELKGVHREQVRQWITALSKRGVEKDTPRDALLAKS